MGRNPVIPWALTTRPFTLVEAQQAGLTRKQLQGASWRRISAGHYAWAGLRENPGLILASVLNRLPAGAAFSGHTAGWLHGLDLAPCAPVEVTIPKGFGTSALVDVSVRQVSLHDSDVIVQRGLPTTSAFRTVFDLGSRRPLIEAVVAVDMALHDGLVGLSDLQQWAAAHCGSKRIKQFRQVVALAEPATESPMETRMRMTLVLAGLPRPKAQIALHDAQGSFLGRADLYYPDQRLILEYDGATHRTSLIEDNRRQNRLLNAGYQLLRFTVADINGTPDAVIGQVGEALRLKRRKSPRHDAKLGNVTPSKDTLEA
jgi:hypothetical protein